MIENHYEKCSDYLVSAKSKVIIELRYENKTPVDVAIPLFDYGGGIRHRPSSYTWIWRSSFTDRCVSQDCLPTESGDIQSLSVCVCV